MNKIGSLANTIYSVKNDLKILWNIIWGFDWCTFKEGMIALTVGTDARAQHISIGNPMGGVCEQNMKASKN